MDLIFQGWPWYVAGPLIALIMFLLIFMGKQFGMSSNLRTLCTMCGAYKSAGFFDFNWRAQKWNLVVIVGAAIGGFIAMNFLMTNNCEGDNLVLGLCKLNYFREHLAQKLVG